MKLLALFCLLVASPLASAHFYCPFCDAPTLTMAEQLETNDHLLLVKWLGGDAPSEESLGNSNFKVIKVGKSEDELFTAGEEITLPKYFALEKDSLYILMGPDSKLINWQAPQEATDDSWNYLTNLPLPVTEPTARAERLAYFIDYLQHPDITVANDAYGEFAAAPYEIIIQVKDKLPREKLRDWLLNDSSAATRTGLYGLLLGLCGNDEDAAAMEELILKPNNRFRLGIEGVMSGYMLIRGEAGLKVLEDERMIPKTYVNSEGETVKVKFSEVYAVMQALRFMEMYEPDVIPLDRLKQSMRLMLKRTDAIDIAIPDLARWKDWSLMPELTQIYTDEEFESPAIKRAIVRYAMFCQKAVPEDSKEVPQHVKDADAFLKKLEVDDPKTLRDVKRFMSVD